MKLKSIIFSGILALAMTASCALTAAADDVTHEAELSALAGEMHERDSEGLPVAAASTVLKQREWDGKSKLKANTCYFIKDGASVTVNAGKTLPASSMIVVENGGKLTIKHGAKLVVKGALIVHSSAKLTVNGQAVIKSKAACVANGTVFVGAKGKLPVYGDLQVSAGGMLSAKGRAAAGKGGRILSFGDVKKLAGGYVSAYTQFKADEKPLYIANEYSGYLKKDMEISGVFDDSMEITEDADKLELLRSFESVLYKYDGEFAGVDSFALNPRAIMTIFMCKCRYSCECCDGPHAISGCLYGWNGIIVDRSDAGDGETENGSFYCSVLGAADLGLFAPVDPDSEEYIRAGEFA